MYKCNLMIRISESLQLHLDFIIQAHLFTGLQMQVGKYWHFVVTGLQMQVGKFRHICSQAFRCRLASTGTLLSQALQWT
jgi:hypothetical protein